MNEYSLAKVQSINLDCYLSFCVQRYKINWINASFQKLKGRIIIMKVHFRYLHTIRVIDPYSTGILDRLDL